MEPDPGGVLSLTDSTHLGVALAAATGLDVTLHPALEIDSAQATCATWSAVLDAVRASQADGPVPVVVAHGTDTLAWTAGALAVSGCLGVPVVLTGANRPATEAGSDALTNLIAAATVATALTASVTVAFAGIPGGPSEVFQAGFVRKMGPAPQPFMGLPDRLGTVVDAVWHQQRSARSVSVARASVERFERRVELVHCHPALDSDPRLAQWESGVVPDAVVIELYRSATAPDAAIRLAAGATQLGVPVWACPPVPVDEAPYLSTRELEAAGTTLVLDATVELLVPAVAASDGSGLWA